MSDQTLLQSTRLFLFRAK